LLKTFSILKILGIFIFGILLGIEHLINEKKREGKWYFNVPRIIILGVSSLIFNLLILLYIYIVKLPNNMLIEFFCMNMPLFGYLISSNFSKKTEINMVTLKNWLRYVIYGLVIFICLVGLSILMSRMYTFVNNIIDRYIPTEILVYFIFGVLLGIEHLINEKKKGCKWHFNISRFIIIGIPSIVVGLYLYGDLYVSGRLVNSTIVNYNYIIPQTMISAFLPVMLIILFGYLLPSEFYHKQVRSSSN
jgi:hypothetical protein